MGLNRVSGIGKQILKAFFFLGILAALIFISNNSFGKSGREDMMAGKKSSLYQKATFAAGCFWGVEEAFRRTKGVVSTSVGYTGGFVDNPSSEMVCMGATGHAEAVEVEFDPSVVSYDELLDVFWKTHNPTTPNRQGPDIGEQYRSVIFFHNQDQEKKAKASRKRIEKDGVFKDPIVTEISSAAQFFKAEEYHQQYYGAPRLKPWSQEINPAIAGWYSAEVDKKRGIKGFCFFGKKFSK